MPSVLTHIAASPGPTPSGTGGSHTTGIALLIVLIVLGYFATRWIRGAARRYRQRLHDDEQS
jgi:hypothetical protein